MDNTEILTSTPYWVELDSVFPEILCHILAQFITFTVSTTQSSCNMTIPAQVINVILKLTEYFMYPFAVFEPVVLQLFVVGLPV